MCTLAARFNLSLVAQEFFDKYGASCDDGSRRREVVLSRSALCVALRRWFTLVEIATATGRTHSTVIYYLKIHEVRFIKNADYRKMYQEAELLVKKHVKSIV